MAASELCSLFDADLSQRYPGYYVIDTTDYFSECVKFCGSPAIVGLVGLVPSCHRTFVGPTFFLEGISLVQNVFYRGYFVSPDFFSWVPPGSEIFSPGYVVGRKVFLVVFLGSKFFLVGISWAQDFFLWMFRSYLVNK